MLVPILESTYSPTSINTEMGLRKGSGMYLRRLVIELEIILDTFEVSTCNALGKSTTFQQLCIFTNFMTSGRVYRLSIQHVFWSANHTQFACS